MTINLSEEISQIIKDNIQIRDQRKMKIITKDYDKSGKLRILKKKPKKPIAIIRFKILKNKKEFSCCDFKGKCTNKAYTEVFPIKIKRNKDDGGSYLCRKHYYQE